ncbi:hypothetical protein IV417_00815 [Alphaproteobacteria bacterium KMM 3653]|uniref:Uncharacterized protein n=1 Tax=Harenicola maris TaxID=2841044 RepID=A0AAP2CK41_9RHOB|nr:hypothetical protein [Harenicola maris]
MSDAPKTLDLTFLLNVMTRVVDDHAKSGVGSVDITDADLYFALPAREALNIYAPPEPPLPVASLMADIAALTELMNDPGRSATPVELETLGNLIRMVAGLSEQIQK